MTDTAKRIAEIEERLRNPLAIPHRAHEAEADLRFLLDRVRELEKTVGCERDECQLIAWQFARGLRTSENGPANGIHDAIADRWRSPQPGEQVRDDEP